MDARDYRALGSSTLGPCSGPRVVSRFEWHVPLVKLGAGLFLKGDIGRMHGLEAEHDTVFENRYSSRPLLLYSCARSK